jgi:dephospho-CoA kinase
VSFLLGLTGSIGMGKSTTAQMFADMGCAVWDADAAVHRLYDKGGAAVDPIRIAFPSSVLGSSVDRRLLKEEISKNYKALNILENIVHPLVSMDRHSFRETASADVLVFDIPLLFETKAQDWLDAVVTVSVDPQTQMSRVLARKTMTTDQITAILERQMPDAIKRELSDFVVVTDTLDHARQQVADILTQIRTS